MRHYDALYIEASFKNASPQNVRSDFYSYSICHIATPIFIPLLRIFYFDNFILSRNFNRTCNKSMLYNRTLRKVTSARFLVNKHTIRP